jgi:hypothetical protein
MARPVEKTSWWPSISAQSLFGLAALAAIVGMLEHPMTPFQSPVYILAVALTFAMSTQFGVQEGVFVGSGFLTLILVSSMFRSDEALGELVRELPVDLFLFGGVAVLPGFLVEMYSAATKDMEEERAVLRERNRHLAAKLQEASRKKAEASAVPVDEARWNKRGNVLADMVRRMAGAQAQGEVVEAFADAIEAALAPSTRFLAVPDGRGGLALSRTPEGGPEVLDPEDPAVREVVKAAKPLGWPQPREIGSGLPATLLVPVLVKGSLVALVGLVPSAPSPKEDLDMVTVMAHLAQEVCARFGLPA